MEYLDVVDENGSLTGQIASRKIIHEKGLWYRASHIWLVRKHNNRIQLLLQKRSINKDSCPNCFDVSCAGHVSAGMSYLDTAIKELHEELNIDIKEKDLYECGIIKLSGQVEVNGALFIDKQIAKVYVLYCDLNEDRLQIQNDEIECIQWFDLDECIKIAKDNEILHCINISELEMIEKGLIL